MKVLILTEQETKFETLSSKIRSDGFEVQKITGSVKATDFLTQQAPDILIVNLNEISANLELIIRKAHSLKLHTILVLSNGSTFDYLKTYGKFSDQILPEDEEIIINHLNYIRYQIKIFDDFTEKFRFYDRLIDCIDEGIIITDENQKITFANNKFYLITGLKSGEIINQSLHKFIYQPDYKLVQQKLPDLLFTDDPENLSLILPSGKKSFSINVIPFLSSYGERKGTLIKIYDRKFPEQIHHTPAPAHLPGKLLNNLSNVIFETDSAGRLIFLNKAWEQLTGFTIGESLGKHFSNFIHPEDIDYSLIQLNSVIQNKKSFCRYDLRIRTKEGGFIWVEVYGRLTETLTENSGTAGTLTDITERINYQKALEDSERIFHSVFENSFDAILLVKDNLIVECNERAAELFKVPQKHLIGCSVFSIPEKRNSPNSLTKEKIKNYLALASGGNSQIFEIKLPASDGTYFDAVVMVNRLLIRGELYFQAAIRDITEKKKKDHQLEKRKLILETASSAASRFLKNSNWETIIEDVLKNIGKSLNFERVYVFQNSSDKNGNITSSVKFEWTKPGFKCYKDDPGLRNFSYLDSGFENWKVRLSKGEVIFGAPESFYGKQKILLQSLNIKTIAVVPIFSGNQWWGNLGFDDCIEGRDWSEVEVEALKVIAATFGAAILRSLIEKNLWLAKDEAENANRLKSQFLANMSHELRTPLVGILGFAEILLQELKSDALKEMADSIVSAGKRLLKTLNSLFDLNKIENRNFELRLTEITPGEILANVVAELMPEAESKNLDLQFISEIQNTRIMADPLMFRQSCLNVIHNAIKYTQEGKIKVRAELVSYENKSWLRISCSDTGIGIPKSHLNLIFEEFRQVSEGYNRNFEGIGLGLTITKKFIELMGGKISVESTPGEGSVFSILLPASVEPTESDSVANREITAEMLTTKINVKYNGRLPEILIVEDDESNLEIVRLFIRKFCNITSCTNSADTLEVIKKKKFDAVIMDINLEEKINGVDLTKMIR